MMYAIIFLALVLGLPQLAHAQSSGNGDKLLADCKKGLPPRGEEGFQTGAHCLGVIQGMRDALTYWRWANEDGKRSPNGEACIPEKASVFEVAQVVVNYLEAHPKERNERDTILILRALRFAYPCK